MIPLFKIFHPQNVGQQIEEVFASGFLTEGEYSDRFEEEFGAFIRNSNTCLTNSCTSALTLAYHVTGIGPGSEVISTPLTCMATNEPIYHSGAKIVWADIDPETGNIDPNDVARKITDSTRAVVGVHWAGQPFDIDGIRDAIGDRDIAIVADAAHALGSSYKQNPIGSVADFTCFSFQAIKHMTTGDGGAVSCVNEKHAERIRKLRWYGLDRRIKGSTRWDQNIDDAGFKMHMNNLTASIGLLQLQDVSSRINRHKANGAFYDANIDNPKITKLKRDKNSVSSQWIYSILVDDINAFKEHMSSNGIATDIVHLRNDKYECFKDFDIYSLSGCDYFCKRLMNIPVGWWLSDSDRNKIVDAVNNYE